MKPTDEIPRRARVDLNVPAERAIRSAIFAVEDLGADTILTEAVMLLGKAQDRVSDFIDGRRAPADSVYTRPISSPDGDKSGERPSAILEALRDDPGVAARFREERMEDAGPSQGALMRFCPASATVAPYPSQAGQWREFHGEMAWLYNPWSGEPRDPRDIGSDTFGRLIVPRSGK